MPREPYEELFRFRGNKIHSDIIEKYQQTYPKYSTKADVHRHAIALLDDEMRKNNGQDDMSLLMKKVSDLERSNNTLRIQTDVLIKLNLELLSRSGSDLTWDKAEQEIKDGIRSSVTKKSENQFRKSAQQMQHYSNEESIQKSSFPKENIEMISDNEKIVMKLGEPHKVRMIGTKEYYEKIQWEQIPEYRKSELE